MGILPEGAVLSWSETKALSSFVQEHGIQQFINLYRKSKDRRGDPFKWGDEIEYMIVKFNDAKREAKVACKSEELLEILNEREERNASTALWRPEYGAFLLESSPLQPFQGDFTHFKTVEPDMRRRRAEVQELLEDDECIMTLVNSLRFGCKNFTYPAMKPQPDDPNSYAKSLFIPDEAIFGGHPRYHMLSRNILAKRGERTQVKIKVFEDVNTKLPVQGSPIKEPDVVTLDTSFGCNLQVTVQGQDMMEARYIYDQLAPLCPLIQAVTAALPIYRGYLTEWDNSYYFIGNGSDERSAEERGLKPLKNDKYRLEKFRWDSIDCYLTPEAEVYNDIHLDYDEKLYDKLRNEGVDHVMAVHVAHLFIRDPLLLFTGQIYQNDEKDTGHFDNLNTSTWQTLRFKPALPDTDFGWRVEFRPCDVQFTDFENAAVSCFVVLLTRAILHYRLNFLMPISKIDENMKIAEKRDACRKEKFWFRKNITKTKTCLNGNSNGRIATNGYTNGYANGHCNGHGHNTNDDAITNGYLNGHHQHNQKQHNGTTNGYTNGVNDLFINELELMTVDEIFNGKVSSILLSYQIISA